MIKLFYELKLFFKRLEILFWWNFIVKKDDFHNQLIYEKNSKKLLAKRRIAHMLGFGFSVWNIPDYLIEEFRL
jgi:hypothetical protein